MWKTGGMRKISLDAIAREQLERAASANGHRASVTVCGGHERKLRQVVVALLTGGKMAEHESGGEATVHVLKGRVRLRAGEDTWEGRSGDLLVVPDARHEVEAVEDSAFLLTVAMRA
jgi:quercetin dioxygenase-like cupin family protein